MTKNRIELARRARDKGAWDYEDEEFTRDDWKSDVLAGDTQLGYFDWVIHNLDRAPSKTSQTGISQLVFL